MGRLYKEWKNWYKIEHPFKPKKWFTFHKYLEWKRMITGNKKQYKQIFRVSKTINNNFNWDSTPNEEDWKKLDKIMKKKENKCNNKKNSIYKWWS